MCTPRKTDGGDCRVEGLDSAVDLKESEEFCGVGGKNVHVSDWTSHLPAQLFLDRPTNLHHL